MPPRPDDIHEFTLRCERTYLRALLALAERERDAGAAELRQRLERVDASIAGVARTDAPMARIASRLRLDDVQLAFFWAAVAVACEGRLAAPLDEIGGPLTQRGLSVAVFADLVDIDVDAAHALTCWLNDAANPLVARGLLVAADDAINAASRPFGVAARVVAHLRGDDVPTPPIGYLAAGDRQLHFDPAQRAVLDELEYVLRGPSPDLVIVVEGQSGAGRRTAIAHAAARRLVTLDAVACDPRRLATALVALRREAFLVDGVPLITNAEALIMTESAGDRQDRALGRTIEAWDVPVIVTTTVPGLDLGTRRPTVRVRWPVPDAPLRRTLWTELGGGPPRGDLDDLAHRYRVGPGGIARAVTTARTLRGDGDPPDVERLAAGLRHNIAERLGGLAHRVDVTQTWDDLVVADHTREQLLALIARVRHSMHVLERWGFKAKLPRGTGVPALFSGPPGTGKSMCAGLIARALDLELYQVDLSQVVSKWVGESEKNLARVFDAAEEGHGLLLFDEADALFGQRSTEVKGAVDRYANLEVNFLLQRIESFGGITILTTNLDTSIDRALKRRLAAHIVFDVPEEDERALLWARLTKTATAPLARDLDVDELARAYPKMTGANIRNAALAAAFLSADEAASAISQDHLHRAARIEYRAMGHVLAERVPGGRSSLR